MDDVYISHKSIRLRMEDKPNQPLKLIEVSERNELKVKDPEKIPNRYICFVKIKIFDGEKKFKTCKGSGVMLSDRYVLTAAHNVYCHNEWIQMVKMTRGKPVDNSYVKLAVHQGTNYGEYSILKIHMANKFPKSKNHDYAILEIEPKPTSEKLIEQVYPPLLVVSNQTLAKVKEISIFGYPIPTNMENHPECRAQNSISNVDMFRAEGPIASANFERITYNLPTEKGISGGPIFAELFGEYVLLGIHKGTTEKEQKPFKEEPKKEHYNFGVTAELMLEELNEWGYLLRKRPFAFTEKTLGLRKTEERIPEMEIFYMADRNLNFKDIQVIISYDLTKLKKIILSGNNVEEQGVVCLTRRPLPSLNSLFLPQNNIRSLDALSQENWRNISGLTLLMLSINKLTVFPRGLALLQKLENLWLSNNRLTDISESMLDFCLGLKQRANLYLYENKIKEELSSNRDRKERIEKSNVHIIWTKQQKEMEGL